jgi:hypothetical protein
VKIETTQSVEVQPHALVYGAPKVGKTRLIPTSNNPIVISTDNGLASIRQHNIPFINCTDWKQCKEAMDWIVTEGCKKYASIWIDDLTEMANMKLLEVLPRVKHGQQAYGEMADEMLARIRAVRQIRGCTVYMICKEERIQDSDLRLVYAPVIPGKSANMMLSYLVGQVYRMEHYVDQASGQVYEVLRTKRTPTIEAGDRSGKLAELELANISQIYAKIMS